MKKTIIIQLVIAGFHRYPLAPASVAFLRDRHRHEFKIKAAFQVEDLDREKEFFIMRDDIADLIRREFGSPAEFGDLSCEAIASFILQKTKKVGGIWIEVWEEETAGARIEIVSE